MIKLILGGLAVSSLLLASGPAAMAGEPDGGGGGDRGDPFRGPPEEPDVPEPCIDPIFTPGLINMDPDTFADQLEAYQQWDQYNSDQVQYYTDLVDYLDNRCPG